MQMNHVLPIRLLPVGIGCATICALLCLSFMAQAQMPPEPGAAAGIELTNLSKNTPKFASVFPKLAVNRANPNIVVVAWRRHSIPVDTAMPVPPRYAECFVSISKDGGKTFVDRNMMDVLRNDGRDGGQVLRGCNVPWIGIANDNTMYFGAAMNNVDPCTGDAKTCNGGLNKVGRSVVSASTDGGRTWSKGVPGVTIARMAPGVTGLGGGMESKNTPWDGNFGFVDPQTATFYLTVGGQYLTSSDDKAKTFGPVYGISRSGSSGAAGFGTVALARIETDYPNAKCPCLVFVTSADKGNTFTNSLVAQAGQFNREGTIRYPIPAANPVKAGSFAIAVYAPDHVTVKVFYTSDYGKNWRMAEPKPISPNILFNNANQVGIGYTDDGRILLTWRAFRNPGAFNTFVAMLDNDTFGPTIKISPELSIYPPLTYAGWYGGGNGGGDFTTWVEGNNTDAFVAFPYAPRGEVLDTYLARVPLRLLK